MQEKERYPGRNTIVQINIDYIDCGVCFKKT